MFRKQEEGPREWLKYCLLAYRATPHATERFRTLQLQNVSFQNEKFKKETKRAYDKELLRGFTSWEIWCCYTLLPCLGALPLFERVLMKLLE